MTKKSRWIFLFLALAVGLILSGFILCFRYIAEKLIEVTWHPQTYTELNSKELIPQLEKNLHISFPQNAREIKTAASWMAWDSRESCYIVKLNADSNSVAEFLHSFKEKPSDLQPYRIEDDTRGGGFRGAPSWFTTPIKQGRVGRFSVTQTNDVKIYLDTADKTKTIVYLMGECYIGQELLDKIKREQHR